MKLLINQITNPVNYSQLPITVQNNISSYTIPGIKWVNVSYVLKDYVRTHYFNEQNQRCAYCGKFYTNPSEMHIEHIAGQTQYLEFIIEPNNLCLSCSVCNQHKKLDNIKPSSYSTIYNRNQFMIYHPHFDNPKNMFTNYYKYLIKGIDPNGKGELTIKVLHLNYEPRIKDRIDELSHFNSKWLSNMKYKELFKKASEYVNK